MVTHLLAIAGEKYGNIPVGKGEDDSIKFVNLLKESRMPSESRTVKWDTVKEIVEKYQVISSLHLLGILSVLNDGTVVHPILSQSASHLYLHHHWYLNSVQDPMMATFPLVLAVEPRLLPYARANGFYMDRKVRSSISRLYADADRQLISSTGISSSARCLRNLWSTQSCAAMR